MVQLPKEQTQRLGVTGRGRRSQTLDKNKPGGDPRDARDQGAAKRGDDYEQPLEVSALLGERRKVELLKADLFTVNEFGQLDIDLTLFAAAQAADQVFLEKTTAYWLTIPDAAEHTIILAKFGVISTIFLMGAAEATGFRFRITSTGTATVVVLPNGAELIAGQVVWNMAPFDSLYIVSTGTEWLIL